MGEKLFQARIMDSLGGRLGASEVVSKWLVETLDIEYSTARRKFNGDIKISLGQFEKIVQRAPYVLADTIKLILGENTFITTYSSFRNKREVDDYLRAIIKRFESALKHKAQLKYVARDLPLFFFLADRRLAEFKISLWSHQLGDNGLMHLDIETFALCKEVHRLYKHLESVEVWNRNMLHNQAKMINWFCGLKRINETYRKGLFEAMEEQIVVYKQWSEAGRKDNAGFIDLLFTDFITMNNGGLIEAEGLQYLMTAISSVNFVTFNDAVLCTNFIDEFEQHRSYAISVSCHNALEREKCFDLLLDELRNH